MREGNPSSIEQRINNQLALAESFKVVVSTEAMRALRMDCLLAFNTNQEHKLEQIFGVHDSQAYKQYSKLLSSQIAEQLNQRITKLKLLKKKLEGVEKGKQGQLQKVRDQYEQQFPLDKTREFWHTQLFLMHNYRLDIAARELQRWNQGLSTPAYNSKEIDDLFS